MPRTFMDSILNRPSQRYAPDPVASSSKARSTGNDHKKWSGPSDLPNRPTAPSSLRTYNPSTVPTSSSSSSNQPSRIYATGPPPPAPSSVADSQGTSRSRFGRKKKTHERNISQTSNTTSFMEDRTSNAGSNATYTKKRWWEGGSIRGFGKGTKSRAGSVTGDSVAGESVFSEPARNNGPSSPQQRLQYGTTPARRGTRSDLGAPTSNPSKVPPLPKHDPALLKAMSNSGRLQSGVAPLGQQPPTLRRNVSTAGGSASATTRHSTLALPSPTLPSAPSRAGSVAASSSISDGGWDDFTKQMSNRDIARSWNRAPASEVAVTRRATVLNRVQKELQQDAQFEQITRDPGVIRGDLLTRATSVVGGVAPTTVEEVLIPELPTNLRPGSIVGMTTLLPSDISRPTSPTALNLVRAVSPPPQTRSMSPPPHPGTMSPSLAARALSPAPQTRPASQAQQQQQMTAPAADQLSQAVQKEESIHPPKSQLASIQQVASEDVSSGSSDSSGEESSSDDVGPPQPLGVLAEEEEDGGSDGGHEMRPGVRSRYLPRASLRHGDSGSPRSPVRFAALDPVSGVNGLTSEGSSGFAGVGARPSSAAVLEHGKPPVPALPSAIAMEEPKMPKQQVSSTLELEQPVLHKAKETAAAPASPLPSITTEQIAAPAQNSSLQTKTDQVPLLDPGKSSLPRTDADITGSTAQSASIAPAAVSELSMSSGPLAAPPLRLSMEQLQRTHDPVSPPTPAKDRRRNGTPSQSPERRRSARSPQTPDRPHLPVRTSSVSPEVNRAHSLELTSLQESSSMPPPTPPKPNGAVRPAPPMSTSLSETSVVTDRSLSSTSSSEGADSGKDGETTSIPTTEAVKAPRTESPKGVKFEGDPADSNSSDESDTGDEEGYTTGIEDLKRKSRALDSNSDAASTPGTETGVSISKPASRRLSDMSLGGSFAFSHFMGSKITGKSSSRRIKLHEDDSNSDADSSGDDDELKKRALLEQKRLRNMSVGEDFFGPSLGDVLLAIDKIDFSKETIEETAALEENAKAQGISLEETTKAQLEAQHIVSEVRRRRAAGEGEVDHTTIHSEAGGLAASFAALWLQNSAAGTKAEEGKRNSPKAVDPPITAPAPTALATFREPSSSTSTTPTKNPRRSLNIMDRPRFRPNKPRQMGGIDISEGKLPAEEIRAPIDERSTLPSVESFYSIATTLSPPTSPAAARKSVDLGDQQRSRDKPAPTKSALKAKPLRHSKSLADTLFSFPTKSPEKKEMKAAKREEKERVRRRSLSEKAAKKAAAKEGKEAAKFASPASTLGHQPHKSEDFSPSLKGDSNSEIPTYPLRHAPQEKTDSTIAAASESGQVQQASEVDREEPPSLVNGTESPSLAYKSDRDESAQSYPDDATISAPQSAPSTLATELTFPDGDKHAHNHAEDTSLGEPVKVDDADRGEQTETTAEAAFGMNIIPPTPPVVGGVDGTNYISSGPNGKLARSTSSGSSSTAVPRKISMLEAAEVFGFKLPPGLTAEVVATSRDSKSLKSASRHRSTSPRKGTSSDGGHSSPHRGSQSDQSDVPPLPKMLTTSARPQQPPLPPKDGSRRYSNTPSWEPSRQTSPAGLPHTSSLSSLSPPPSTGSRTGSAPSSSAGADDSPARSGGSGSSGGQGSRSDTYGVSNMAASDTLEHPRQPARVRTQSSMTQLNRRTQPMSAINEWESASPVNGYGGSGYTSPVRTASPIDGLLHLTAVSASRSASPLRAGEKTPSEIFLHPPVPRSRLSVDERQRLAFEAHTNGSERPYASSDGGHGGSEYGSRYSTANNSVVNVGGSVDGHGSQARWTAPRPVSVLSSYSVTSVPASLASLPTAPTSRSAYRPQDPVKAASSSTVDDRLYSRTTMATVSVSSGAFASKRGGVKTRKVNGDGNSRRSLDGPAHSASETVPEHLQDELGLTVLSLSAHTPPPRKVGSDQILVQVITVALDEMDRMLLRDKVRNDCAYGWVPGRSFCGRVMEVGWEVKRMRKGDMIFGLQSSRKSGALAEFMVVDQDLVAKAPEDCLTVEQIAALPSTGVLTYQIVQNHCIHLPKGARVLILNAHDGTGLLTLQECASLGLILVAQCPPSISDGLAVCEANGAHEVVVGEPLWAMNSLHESSFDLVIDTIGGRRLYEAARRILASDGQFVTCFGDEHSISNPNFRSHMRSLRRTFFKKDKKNLRYEWTGMDNAEDCKEALENVRAVAESGDICPRLRSILPFEDAPRAFDPVTRGGMDEEPGAVVVRVS